MSLSKNKDTAILVGIDFGGTQGKFVTLDLAGKVLHTQVVTNTQQSAQETSEVLWRIASIQKYIETTKNTFGVPASLGISFPGLASQDGRRIQYLPGKLIGVEGIDWQKELDLNFPVRVVNDAQAALLAESWIGSAQHKLHVVLLTLGTGVGGALMIGGQLIQGATGRAGHFGHIILERNGPRDIFDVPGTLEWYLGNATVGQRTNYRWASMEALVTDVKHNNQLALSHWNEWIQNLAAGIVSIINSVDPELIVLGGGVTLAGNLILTSLLPALTSIEWCPFGNHVPIVLSKFQEFGGAIGAAKFAYDQLGK